MAQTVAVNKTMLDHLRAKTEQVRERTGEAVESFKSEFVEIKEKIGETKKNLWQKIVAWGAVGCAFLVTAFMMTSGFVLQAVGNGFEHGGKFGAVTVGLATGVIAGYTQVTGRGIQYAGVQIFNHVTESVTGPGVDKPSNAEIFSQKLAEV